MAFRQLHYTSCEIGLSGHSGFQFCAMTPGVPEELSREVERLTVYELPRSATGHRPQSESPVNLIYVRSEGSRSTIIARVVSAGTDFSNRPGNYFAHALVTDNPGEDLGVITPAEFWGAPFWESSQRRTTELPPLPSDPPIGPVTRGLVDDFLAADPGRSVWAAQLLTAADAALSGGKQVLLTDSDSMLVCYWIAAVCYLAGPHLARDFTFATYSHDPGRCRAVMVGTVPGIPSVNVNRGLQFQRFDLQQEPSSAAEASPSASLLASIGVVAAAPVWELAEAIGLAPGSALADSLPAVACAALLLAHKLTSTQLSAAVGWMIAGQGGPLESRMTQALQLAVTQPIDGLPASQQQALIDMSVARGLNEVAAVAEQAVVSGVLDRLRRGDELGESVILQTPRIAESAAAQLGALVPELQAYQIIDLLRWAYEAGIRLPPEAIRMSANAVVLHLYLEDQSVSPGLAVAAQRWPDLRAGIVTLLVSQPAAIRERVMSGPIAETFQLADFMKEPSLGEEWLLQSVRQGRRTAAEALEGAAVLRRNDDRSPVDHMLIRQLWQGRLWSSEESSLIISLLPVGELANDALIEQFAKTLNDVPSEAGLASWTEYVLDLAGLAPSALADPRLAGLPELVRAIRLALEISQRGPELDPRSEELDPYIEELASLYRHQAEVLDIYLLRSLPSLLVYHSNLGTVLNRCSREIWLEFRAYVQALLRRQPREFLIAAKVFVAMHRLGLAHGGRKPDFGDELLDPMRTWRKSDKSAAAEAAGWLLENGEIALQRWLADLDKRWLPRTRRRGRGA